MKKITYFILIFILFLFSCTKKDNVDTNDILTKEALSIEGQPIVEGIQEIDMSKSQGTIKKMYVNSPEGLRIRNSPSVEGERIGFLDYMTEIVVIRENDDYITIDGIVGRWTFIESNNLQGWVFGGYLSAQSDEGNHPLTNWTFADGTPFAYRQDRGTAYIDFKDIAYGNDRFVAVGDSSAGSFVYGYIAYSNDGLTWNLVNMSFRNGFRSVAYGNDRFVATAANGKSFYSDDGIEWESGQDTAFGDPTNIVYGNGLFLGKYHAGLAYSYDGESWHQIENNIDGLTRITCLFYGNNRFYAGNMDGELAYSYDGKTWNKVGGDVFGSLPITGIAYGNNRLLVFSYLYVAEETLYINDHNITYSDDGEKWHSTGSKKGERSELSWIRNLTYNNGYFIAVGGVTHAELMVGYSRDGINWTTISDGSFPYFSTFNHGYYAGVYGAGKYVIVGSGGTVRVSPW